MHLMLRCTTRCNLNCTYCFEKKTNHLSKIMTYGELKSIFLKARYYLLNVDKNAVLSVEWTGGEPLLLGPKYFERAFKLQKRIFNGELGKRLTNSIQTNGTLINKKLIRLFKKYNVNLGVSWDLAGEHRSNTNKKIQSKIEMLLRSNAKFGVIVVVTNKNVHLMKKIYKIFKAINVSFHFNPLNKGASIYDETVQPTMDDLVKNSLETIKVYYRDNLHKRASIKVLNLQEDIDLARYNSVQKARLCPYRLYCFKDFLTIEPGGDCYPCPTFKSKESYLGNISKHSMAYMLDHPYRRILNKRRVSLLRHDCASCELKYGCNGGCVAEAYHMGGSLRRGLLSCEYRRKIVPLIKKQVLCKKI